MKQHPDYHSTRSQLKTEKDYTEALRTQASPPPSLAQSCVQLAFPNSPRGGGVRRPRKHLFLLCERRGMRPVWIVDVAGWWGCSCVSYAGARVGAARSAIGPHRAAPALHPVGEKGQGSDDNPWRQSSVASSSCMPVGAAGGWPTSLARVNSPTACT